MATNVLSYQWGEELRTGLYKDENQFCVFAFLTAVPRFQQYSVAERGIHLCGEGLAAVFTGYLPKYYFRNTAQ